MSATTAAADRAHRTQGLDGYPARLWNKLTGKLFIYVGDMDNYYLNNAVYLFEDFLEKATSPAYAGEVDYGDRAEHCWNGDQARPNATSRLRTRRVPLPHLLRDAEGEAR